MKNLLYLLLVSLMAITMVSCGSSKGVPYLQDLDENGIFDAHIAEQSKGMYDATIMPKDLLTITVSATEPEAVRPFNLLSPSFATSTYTTGQTQLQTYLVNNAGYVNFPVIGEILLKGLTKNQAEDKIKALLMDFVKEEPIVAVNFVNFKIAILGEVKSPNTYTILNDKVNIFEALAMSGDMTIYGKRDNVKIIREDAEGRKSIIHMNLNDKNIIYGDNFYLQQNDVVYVEPNKIAAQGSGIGASTSLWFTATGLVFSVASLVLNIIRLN